MIQTNIHPGHSDQADRLFAVSTTSARVSLAIIHQLVDVHQAEPPLVLKSTYAVNSKVRQVNGKENNKTSTNWRGERKTTVT